MFQPIIGFLIFFSLIIFIITSSNKSLQNKYDQIIESIKKNDLKLFIEQTTCSNTTFGMNNRDYLFRKCDFYLTSDAIIIFGYSKYNMFKQLSTPIILTKNITKYKTAFSFAIVKDPVIISLNQKEDIVIKFGEADLTKTFVKMQIKISCEANQNIIKAFTDNF